MTGHKSSLIFMEYILCHLSYFLQGYNFNFVQIFQQYSKKEDFSFPAVFFLLLGFVVWLILCHKSTLEFLLLSLVDMNTPP